MPAIPGSVRTAAAGAAGAVSGSATVQGLLRMGRSAVGARGSANRKILGGAVLGGMFLAGMGKVVGRGMIDAGMDVAFGDPNADQKMLGTKLTPSLMLGGLYPGEASGAGVAAGTIGGGAAGATAGGLIGRRFGVGKAGALIGGTVGALVGGYGASAATGGVGSVARGMNPTRFPVDTFGVSVGATQGLASAGFVAGGIFGGVKGYQSGGKMGALKGFVKGAGVGTMAGGGVGALMVGGSISSANQSRRMNQQIIDESPFYNSSLLTAERLNARGDIVLGAHNTRRGGY